MRAPLCSALALAAWSAAATASPAEPRFAPCAYQDPFDCVAAPGCGFCLGSFSCMPGDESGPANGSLPCLPPTALLHVCSAGPYRLVNCTWYPNATALHDYEAYMTTALSIQKPPTIPGNDSSPPSLDQSLCEAGGRRHWAPCLTDSAGNCKYSSPIWGGQRCDCPAGRNGRTCDGCSDNAGCAADDVCHSGPAATGWTAGAPHRVHLPY